MGIYNDINKRLEESKVNKKVIIDLLNNKNLNNSQNYIITDKKKKNIFKKISKLFYFGFTDNKKRLAKYGIIKKIEVPFFSAKILFFGVFILIFSLLLYLLITEYSIGILFAFVFILLWGYIVFLTSAFQGQLNLKVLYDKDRYIYYFYKKKF